tara:strand:- start:8989 stop:9687 length:699 start_codon:yes stop_codon:yes gene_type:complete
MGLPIIQHPTFGLTIPSTKEEIRYRPFLVKEEKILLVAQQTGQPDEFIKAMIQVLNNCTMDYSVDKLASFDIEYMFLKLRASSVSTLAKIQVWDDETEDYVQIEVDLDKVECSGEIPTNIIDVNDDVKLQLRPPSFTDLLVLGDNDQMSESIDMVTRVIEKIYEGEEVYELKDFSEEEQTEFINSLPAEAFQNIQNFLTSLPSVEMEVDYKIKKNGKNKNKKTVLKGLNDFF